MNKLIAGGAAALLLSVAAPALAQPAGLYVAGDIGYQQPGDMDGTSLTVIPPATIVTVPVTAEYEGGWQGVGRIGYRLNDNWRLELEGAYRRSDIDNIGGAQYPDTRINASTLMGNVLYDFGPADAQWRPFVGAGVGGGSVELDGVGSDEDSGTAWQLLGGAAWSLSDRLSLDATYRYVQIRDLDLGGIPNFQDSYTNHSVSIGVRYAFGGPR